MLLKQCDFAEAKTILSALAGKSLSTGQRRRSSNRCAGRVGKHIPEAFVRRLCFEELGRRMAE